MTRAPVHRRRAEAWLTRAGIAWEPVRYPRPEAGGDATAYRLRPAGPPRARVVAAHGAGNDALFPLVGLYAALAAAGVEVFAFDADGHGWSATTRFHPRSARSAVASALAAAARDGDPLPTHLLGHSLGGSLVLGALAGDAPPAVRSAILLSAPVSVAVGFRVAAGELLGFLHPATLRETARYGAWGVVPAVGRLKRRAFPFRQEPPAAGAFGYVRAVSGLLRALDVERAAGAVDLPVLLVYGCRDRLVPATQGELLARALGDAELVRVPGATHWTLPLAPRTADAAVRWVARHAPAAGPAEGAA